MEHIFNGVKSFTSDIYLGDYTEYARKHTECTAKGVTLSDVPQPLIPTLHVVNKQHVSIKGVSFESNLGYFRGKGHQLSSNCECMLVSYKAKKKGWLILAELKYCGAEEQAITERTVIENFELALAQLKDTFLYLRDVKHLFGEKDYRYYWVLSMPDHDEMIPFSQFYHSPEKLLEYQDLYHASLLDTNVVQVLTHQHVKKA